MHQLCAAAAENDWWHELDTAGSELGPPADETDPVVLYLYSTAAPVVVVVPPPPVLPPAAVAAGDQKLSAEALRASLPAEGSAARL